MKERTDTEPTLSTADFVATGERRDQPDTPIENRGGTAMAREEAPAPLFNENQAQDMRNQWHEIQGTFVDEPREAVKKADELVAAAMRRLAEMFSEERNKLEHQWDHGGDISTEDLRVAMQRYRSFFNRLLSV